VTRLYLVRHGRAAAAWDKAHDPGLDDVGRAQAEAMAEQLAPLGPMPLIASPLQRTRQTVAALEARWNVAARIEPAVAEIPSPPQSLEDRGAWLKRVLTMKWSALESDLIAWREALLAALTGIGEDSVVVTHFVAINAAVGAATGDDRLICFRPDTASHTVMEVRDGALHLIEKGREAETQVR
jgi:broad specificity phosphatase PhoE